MTGIDVDTDGNKHHRWYECSSRQFPDFRADIRFVCFCTNSVVKICSGAFKRVRWDLKPRILWFILQRGDFKCHRMFSFVIGFLTELLTFMISWDSTTQAMCVSILWWKIKTKPKKKKKQKKTNITKRKILKPDFDCCPQMCFLQVSGLLKKCWCIIVSRTQIISSRYHHETYSSSRFTHTHACYWPPFISLSSGGRMSASWVEEWPALLDCRSVEKRNETEYQRFFFFSWEIKLICGLMTTLLFFKGCCSYWSRTCSVDGRKREICRKWVDFTLWAFLEKKRLFCFSCPEYSNAALFCRYQRNFGKKWKTNWRNQNGSKVSLCYCFACWKFGELPFPPRSFFRAWDILSSFEPQDFAVEWIWGMAGIKKYFWHGNLRRLVRQFQKKMPFCWNICAAIIKLEVFSIFSVVVFSSLFFDGCREDLSLAIHTLLKTEVRWPR